MSPLAPLCELEKFEVVFGACIFIILDLKYSSCYINQHSINIVLLRANVGEGGRNLPVPSSVSHTSPVGEQWGCSS